MIIAAAGDAARSKVRKRLERGSRVITRPARLSEVSGVAPHLVNHRVDQVRIVAIIHRDRLRHIILHAVSRWVFARVKELRVVHINVLERTVLAPVELNERQLPFARHLNVPDSVTSPTDHPETICSFHTANSRLVARVNVKTVDADLLAVLKTERD